MRRKLRERDDGKMRREGETQDYVTVKHTGIGDGRKQRYREERGEGRNVFYESAVWGLT